MRFPTLLSAASFAFALASPALAQQPNDMREEIRRIVREEVRAALREAMQEMHGVAPRAGGQAAKAKQAPARTEPVVRRFMQPNQVESIELQELETEMKELEKTLERLQGEIGKNVGGQLRELQPLLLDLDGMKVDLKDLPHGLEGARVLKLGGDGEAIEIDGARVHVITPKEGQRVIKFDDFGEKRTEKKEKTEKTEKKAKKEAKEPSVLFLESEGETKAEESKPKAKKTVKAAKTPLSIGSMTLPVLDKAMVVPASGDGCNCVIVIRCENGKCTIETNCDGVQQAPLQFKTLLPKVMKKAGGDSEDCTLQIKVDTGCCDETPAKAKSDCCTGGACTDCAPAKSGCCDEAKTETRKPEAKATDKKKLIS